MKYARIAINDEVHWGAVDGDAVEVLAGTPYERAVGTGRVEALEHVRLLAPVAPSKIFCLGRNYAEHVAEMGYQPLEGPSVFMKGSTTVIGPGEPVVLPPQSMDPVIEHEAELAIVIGRPARFVAAADAAEVILGYACADDVSARTLQRGDPHPTRGKGFDTFCPVGPWIDTQVDPIAGTSIRCSVNGELRQDASTAQMIHGIPELIEYLSGFATLLPGDLILTGSPGGSGPLAPGDRVEIEIGGIGTLVHGVLASDRP